MERGPALMPDGQTPCKVETTTMIPATGYAMREENRPYAGEPAWNAVEVDFQRASHPLRLEPYLTGFSFDYVSIHALELSVSSPDAPADRFLDALVEVAEENGAVAISDHLGFNHGRPGGPGAGHVMTPPLTQAALDVTCRNLEIIQRRFDPFLFYVENLAHFFVLEGTLAEETFFRRMLERTGCGLLLDITNTYANQQNFGTSAREFIEAVIPAAGRLQIHLAGGFYHPGAKRYIDSHSEPIPEDVWDLYKQALELAGDKIDAVFIERDWNFPKEEGWRNEVHRARTIAERLESQRCRA
jgi:uncharacterized protein